GQCRAAHDLCTSLPETDKMHFTCPYVGHYGIFNGSRFRREIAPRIAAFARARDPRTKAGIAAPALERRSMQDKNDPELREISSSAFTFGSNTIARPVRAAKRRNDTAAPRRASHPFAAD